MSGNPWAATNTPIAHAAGKTVESVETVKVLYGRTVDNVLLIRFTDGSRSAVGVKGICDVSTRHVDLLDSDAMREATKFFTEDEIAAQVVREVRERKDREDRSRREKQQRLEQLQRELA